MNPYYDVTRWQMRQDDAWMALVCDTCGEHLPDSYREGAPKTCNECWWKEELADMFSDCCGGPVLDGGICAKCREFCGEGA